MASSSRRSARAGSRKSQRQTDFTRHLEKGFAAFQRGDYPAAVRHYERAVADRPLSAEAHNDLGNAYRCAWRLADALESYRRAVDLDPSLVSARHNLGVTFLAAGDANEAIRALEMALLHRPNHRDTLISLAEAYGRASRPGDVARVVDTLRAITGNDTPSIDRALGLHHLGERTKAIEAFEEVLRTDPASFDAWRFLGLLLVEEARYAHALDAFDHALALRPDSAEVRFYRSLELLRSGDFARGFEEYESRWRYADFTSPRRHPDVPEWDGRTDPSVTLLLHTEQGAGDTLQFTRFARAARERVGRVILECETELLQLLSMCEGVDEVIGRGDPIVGVDFHLPLLSLPHTLSVTLESLSAIPYLRADGESALSADSRPSIGIVWAGSASHANDRNRSCSPADFAPLIASTDARFISLQKSESAPRSPVTGEGAAPFAPADVTDIGSHLGDWIDTARVVRDLDLVITVDTAVAHLAGGMGKDVWVLLPFDADWRWMTGRDDSPWYPTMRLFRQKTPGDWKDVFTRVVVALKTFGTSTSDTMSQPLRAASDLEHAVAIFREAVALHARQDLAGAERLYRQSIDLHPDIAEAHNNLGAILGDTDRRDEAREAFAKAVEINPEYGEALNNLGLLYSGAGDNASALQYLERALRTGPARVDWVNNLGNAYLEALRIEDAVAAYEQAIALDPSFVYARNNRAVALRGLARYDESIAELKALISADPDYFEAVNNLGLSLRDSGRRAEAIAVFEQALALRPHAVEAMVNLGVTYQEMGRHEEARRTAAAILDLEPASHDAFDIYGHCAYEEGDYDGAFELFGRAIALRPDDVNAHWNRALLNLHRGQFREGFTGYEWRKKLVAFARNRRSIETPEWNGSPLSGESVLVISEQGLGDALQFVRYVPLLREAGAGAVHVECDPALVDLIRSIPAVDSVVPRGTRLPEHDAHVYMLSLPGLLGTDGSNIPARTPYLTAPARAAADAVAEEGVAVGFVWGGSPGHSRDHIRSATLEHFERLFSVPGTTFHSLQKGGAEAALSGSRWPNVWDLSALLSDFSDTAAVIDRLDLVITVDTSVAHLAGALRKQTWLLLPFVCDFRWMAEGETSPWYPSMRLFRQPAAGDWDSVFDRVRAELEALVGARDHGSSESAGGRAMPGEITRFSGEPAPENIDSDHHEAVRELLQAGDTFVDVDAGSGDLIRAMATAGMGRPGKIIAIAAPAEADILRRNFGTAGDRSIVIHESSHPADSAHLLGVEVLRSARSLVSFGSHSHILGTPAGRSLLADDRLAGVFWRPAGIDTNEIAAALARAGFDHFRIARDEEGVLLEMASDISTQLTIISLRSSRLEEFRGDSNASQAAGGEIAALSTASVREAAAATPIEPIDGGTDPEGNRVPASLPDRTEPTVPALIGIDWPIGGSSGWQVYGSNLATHLATRAGTEPLLAFLPDPQGLPPIARFALRETIARSSRPTTGSGMLALRALGNRVEASSHPCWPAAATNVGVIFFEDTRLLPDALNRARSYDAIVAGSTWNAEVLAANGLDNVVLSLQGIDPTLFHPAPPSGLFGDRFVIFSGGKLEYRKGQDIVVAAFREFRKRHPEALLLFAWHNHWPQIMEEITFGGHVHRVPGVDSQGRIDFEGWLLDHGLPDGSFLDLGIVPNAQMGQLLREAHVGLFPNRSEGGTNLVAMELMACGVPTILSANTGHLDLLGESGAYPLLEQGIVAPSGHCPGNEGWGESSVEEIVEVLERILTDRAEAAERAARSAAFMKQLSWANQVEHLVMTLSPLF